MNYFLTDEQKAIKKLARQIAEEKVKPVRQHLDETGEFPYEIMKEFSQAGLLGIYIPEEYGGAGGGVFEMCLVVEEISRICGGVGVCYAANGLAAYPIILSASEEQKKKYLPKMASGEWIGAFGLTEPNAGSDASSIQTTAVRDGDYYVLNGTKHFITNGEVAHLYTIIASTNPERGGRGLSAFIVEKGTPGFTFGKHENKMGIRASITTELIFQDCRVPVENRIGPEGTGFITAMRTFDRTRPGVGAQALGIAQGALEAATEYTQQRVQFGAPISSLQGIQFRLAEMATKIEAARALVYAAARHADSGAKDIAGYSSMAKFFASDVAMQVTIEAVQLFGGYGYMKDYPVEKMMRDAKITQIYEGTNEIQRLVIARELLRGNLFKEY
ncbi:MAG: acyl-CoA dehydrogenase family protein [candidate division WOR-3 bacterium]